MPQLDTLRVKRKRTDSAIPTLYVENPHRQQRKVSKRLKVSNYLYRLAQTSEEAPTPGADNIYLESDESNKRQFRVVQQRGSVSGPAQAAPPQEHQEELSKEEDPTGLLSSMVESYLRVSGDAIKDPTRKRRHTSAPGDDEMAMEFATENDMDYVYDVYHREPTSTATAPDASAPDIGLIVVDSDDEKLFGLEDDEEDSDYVLTDDEDSNAEDFYKNDYPDEDYSSDYTHAADDDVEEEEAAWHLRQQLAEENGDEAAQVGYDENDYPDTYIGRTISDGEGNDDDDYNRSSTNNYNEGGYLGEDEDMEHYRDRIFEDLQRQIEKRKSISSHLKKQ